MRSDERTQRALAALARPRGAFYGALVAAVDELGAFVARQRAPAASKAAQESARLGAFGAQRIDTERFGAVVGATESVDRERLARIEQKLSLLRTFVQQDEALYRLVIAHGVDLQAAVSDALAARGSVFRAAHEAGLLRSGQQSAITARAVALSFRHWRRAEKALAPPLVIELSGAELHPAALAEFMDGAQKIVFIVEGAAAPAPLVRLITPRTFVMQTSDAAELDRLGAYDGPGIAAVLPSSCARFVHDPTRGATLAQRLEISFLPESSVHDVSVGSSRQQADELTWLAELGRLAAADRAATATESAQAQIAPADQLAGWLLRLATNVNDTATAGD